MWFIKTLSLYFCLLSFPLFNLWFDPLLKTNYFLKSFWKLDISIHPPISLVFRVACSTYGVTHVFIPRKFNLEQLLRIYVKVTRLLATTLAHWGIATFVRLLKKGGTRGYHMVVWSLRLWFMYSQFIGEIVCS